MIYWLILLMEAQMATIFPAWNFGLSLHSLHLGLKVQWQDFPIFEINITIILLVGCLNQYPIASSMWKRSCLTPLGHDPWWSDCVNGFVLNSKCWPNFMIFSVISPNYLLFGWKMPKVENNSHKTVSRSINECVNFTGTPCILTTCCEQQRTVRNPN